MDGIEVMRQFLLATTLCTALASAALAQVQPASVPAPVIYPTAASLSVSTGSARIALPAAQLQYPAALLVNAGPSEVFIVPGDNTTVATTAGIPIEPGGCVPVWVGASLLTGGVAPTNIAAITAGGASTLRVVQANSLAACGGAPGAVAATISGALPAGTNSIGSVTTAPNSATPLGYQQITSLTGAVSLTVPVGATRVELTIEGSSVRWRDDGAAPTASVGMPLAAGADPWLYSGNLAAIEFIQITAGAVLNASYYR